MIVIACAAGAVVVLAAPIAAPGFSILSCSLASSGR